jgi:hypothetical protein
MNDMLAAVNDNSVALKLCQSQSVIQLIQDFENQSKDVRRLQLLRLRYFRRQYGMIKTELKRQDEEVHDLVSSDEDER